MGRVGMMLTSGLATEGISPQAETCPTGGNGPHRFFYIPKMPARQITERLWSFWTAQTPNAHGGCTGTWDTLAWHAEQPPAGGAIDAGVETP
ncbi:hypothetical protein MAPG_03475 [Magnaporthiopsis poae ATCC 64411]|uniref:Uncharacterized protein n=1 Tax=Magnaporthiopsis poae (strain ATCC 64411 / 73-15) TaxID=644358 RepID=A0A0C4DU42_MAGP6|nr:hypothetical protein MAPG_03475 [Magnaporthiopsis poae ATCC 64411]